MAEALRLAGQQETAATPPHDERTRVLKHANTFAVFDRYGDIALAGGGEQGLYHQGTRHLSLLTLRVSGERPILLNSSVDQDNVQLSVDMTMGDHELEDNVAVRNSTIHIVRAVVLWKAACHEHVRIVNYGERALRLDVTLDFGADFADVFEVRGFSRSRRGEDLPPRVSDDRVILGYTGLDRRTRHTRIAFAPRPNHLTANRAEYSIQVAPMGESDFYVTVDCEEQVSPRGQVAYGTALSEARHAVHGMRDRGASVFTSNSQFNDWLNRSAADLAMLTVDNPEVAYPYAGVPWYSTPFGRDGIITALEYLWVDPALARGVLAFLAQTQSTTQDPSRDAEPGKIIHEMREGELAAIGDIPFGQYYGSVDATPLFVVLAGEYFRRSGDIEFLKTIWPNVERALAWMDRYGDIDGDGFIEYRVRRSSGLLHQGWKDSENAIFHKDGRPAEGSVALAEVQGYAYLAKLSAAKLASALAESTAASRLRNEAALLQKRFAAAFWSDEIGTFAIALDGDKRQCQVRSSNAGQVLWSGIASERQAYQAAQTLFAPTSFTGWGVRTIAEGEANYNPMSYHNGSIWPHDNALITMGLAEYGLMDKALALSTSLFDASLFTELHRLPELYCGFARRPSQGPTLYPVACSPQAWASASAFYVLQACLGLSFHAHSPRIRFTHPTLPPYLDRVEITNLRVGDSTIDLALDRHEHDVGVHCVQKRGRIDVSVVL